LKQKLIAVVLNFAVLIFLSAALVNALEKFLYEIDFPSQEPTLLTFHDTIYYIILTLTTVGYGDVTPTGPPTRYIILFFPLLFYFISLFFFFFSLNHIYNRILAIILLVIYVLFLPIQISRLAKTLDAQSKFQNQDYTINRKHPHIILTGSVTFPCFLAVLREV